MFSIGDFAKLGRVSVRMLRHYDSLGLLRPVRVDDRSGYRFYEAAQLARLNRILALKNLGFTLGQVADIVEEKLDVEQMRGMLRLRQAELERKLAEDAERLSRVEVRLRMIEQEGRVDTAEVVLKRVPPVRVAQLVAAAESYEPQDIGPVIQPLYRELGRRVDEAGLRVVGAGIAYYEPVEDERVRVHATFPVSAELGKRHGLEVVDLPAVEVGALLHHGSMDFVDGTIQSIGHWLGEHGHQPDGYAREVYLDYCPETPEAGVTEIQIALAMR